MVVISSYSFPYPFFALHSWCFNYNKPWELLFWSCLFSVLYVSYTLKDIPFSGFGRHYSVLLLKVCFVPLTWNVSFYMTIMQNVIFPCCPDSLAFCFHGFLASHLHWLNDGTLQLIFMPTYSVTQVGWNSLHMEPWTGCLRLVSQGRVVEAKIGKSSL